MVEMAKQIKTGQLKREEKVMRLPKLDKDNLPEIQRRINQTEVSNKKSDSMKKAGKAFGKEHVNVVFEEKRMEVLANIK